MRRGEKSTPVVLWRPIEREVKNDEGEKETKVFWLLRYYSVLNVQQCEGLELAAMEPQSPSTR